MSACDRFGFRKFSFTRSALDHSATAPPQTFLSLGFLPINISLFPAGSSSPEPVCEGVWIGNLFSGEADQEPVLPTGPGQVRRPRLLRPSPGHQAHPKLQVRLVHLNLKALVSVPLIFANCMKL